MISNRKLIVELSRNDFKSKFAGSILGRVWAFVQPIINILVYWFVFSVGIGMKSLLDLGGDADVPYILWLIAGLIPWFFFGDALQNATRALLDYNYLVKKVVFNISILPIVRIMSSLFVHVFFMAGLIILYSIYGIFPTVSMLQIIYYSFAMFVLVVGLSYINASVVVFFKDWAQIITIAVNLGIWITPIMWNIQTVNLPEWLRLILKLNPMYYIVNGYRQAMIYGTPFWAEYKLTIWFWALAIILLGVGTSVFRRLRPHFADVL